MMAVMLLNKNGCKPLIRAGGLSGKRDKMFNVTEKLEGNILTLSVDLSKTGKASKTGKSLVIGSSEGNRPVTGKMNVKFGINVYKGINS